MIAFLDRAPADRVLELVAQIPLGKVSTYKQIACLAGLKNPRQVGQVLRRDPRASGFPCHRVIRSDGKVADGTAFGERFGQIVLLRNEGVICLGGKIDLSTFIWKKL